MNSILGASDSTNIANIIGETQGASKSLGQEDFLKLMMKQLQLQSPTDPTDSGEMLRQMSELSALSTNQNLQKSLDSMMQSMSSSQALQASNVVGKSVKVASNMGVLTTGDGLSGAVSVPKNASDVQVVIKDQAGNIVKELPLGNASEGLVDFKWDGVGGTPGVYSISATGTVSGQSQALQTAAVAKVSSVTLLQDGKGLTLNLEGLGAINFKDILQMQ